MTLAKQNIENLINAACDTRSALMRDSFPRRAKDPDFHEHIRTLNQLVSALKDMLEWVDK
jgi:hypothetical protein